MSRTRETISAEKKTQTHWQRVFLALVVLLFGWMHGWPELPDPRCGDSDRL